MPEYLAPGVYVEEVDTGPKPIEGVSTSTSGMVGVTERGPINVPTLVTSFSEYKRIFGGYLDRRIFQNINGELWHLPHAVEGFFQNGGKRVYLVRVLPEKAAFAEVCINVPILNTGLTFVQKTLDGDAVQDSFQFKVDNVTDLLPGMWVQLEGATVQEQECAYITDIDTGTKTITIDRSLRLTHLSGKSIKEVSDLIVRAIDAGAWGNALRVICDQDDPTLQTTVAKTAVVATDKNKVILTTTVGVEQGSILEFIVEKTVKSVDASAKKVTLGSALGVALKKDIEVRIKGQKQGTQLSSTAAAADTDITLNSVDGIEAHAILEFSWFQEKVANVSGKTATLAHDLSNDVPEKTSVRTREFRLQVDLIQINPLTLQVRTIQSETHRHLATDPNHSRYMVKIIGSIPTVGTPLRADGRTEGESDLIRVAEGLSVSNAAAAIRTRPDVGSYNLSGGDDSVTNILDGTYVGQDGVNPQDRAGLFALKNIEEVSIVAIPGRTNQLVQEALINHCELMRYRCAVLDSRRHDGMAEVQVHRGLYDTKYAAIYYPWLQILDPFPENPQAQGTVLIPPSGHTMGIYARSDIERGVHKAPANEVIRGISNLEVKLMKEHQDILNPRNINVLRNFRENNRGLRVWGARTLSSDPDWKYVNVRRLFIFIEHSIDKGTQWVVFEPNNEALWARVRRVITNFLTQVWHDGALMGTKPEQAFYVKCDRTTMTQNDIDNGRLIVEIGIAPVKPAEFVIFRIGQWTGGSTLEEV